MEYYSTTKRNGLMMHIVVWMNLKIIMLKEAR